MLGPLLAPFPQTVVGWLAQHFPAAEEFRPKLHKEEKAGCQAGTVTFEFTL